jgi:hypothetical protein
MGESGRGGVAARDEECAATRRHARSRSAVVRAPTRWREDRAGAGRNAGRMSSTIVHLGDISHARFPIFSTETATATVPQPATLHVVAGEQCASDSAAAGRSARSRRIAATAQSPSRGARCMVGARAARAPQQKSTGDAGQLSPGAGSGRRRGTAASGHRRAARSQRARRVGRARATGCAEDASLRGRRGSSPARPRHGRAAAAIAAPLPPSPREWAPHARLAR